MNTEPTVPFQSAESFARKYREIILSIVVFIVLDLGVLILNFGISFQLQEAAVGVNLAGRQRMLSQRTVKALYQLQAAQEAGLSVEAARKELALSFELFDSTLNAFNHGGTVTGGHGEKVTLAKLADPEPRAPLEQGVELWTFHFREALLPLLSEEAPSPEAVAHAVQTANAVNLKLLELMNQFTSSLQARAELKAAHLRHIQTVAIVLVLVNFAVVIVHAIGKLKRGDRAVAEFAAELQRSNSELERLSTELISAKKEADSIFGSVRQGLFLLSPQLVIGAQVSRELETIFEDPSLAGRNLVQQLKSILSEKQLGTVNDFLGLLFDPRKSARQLQKFNPLHRVECSFARAEGGYKIKQLEFSFQRILVGEVVDRVLVTVFDATEQVNLERQIEQTEARREKQLDLLLGILHVEPEALREFLVGAQEDLSAINGILREEVDNGMPQAANREKIQRLFQRVHRLKGNAGLLGLTRIQKSAHEIESKLAIIRGSSVIQGEDFLSPVVLLADLQSDLGEISELIQKMGAMRQAFEPARMPSVAAPASESFEGSLRSLAGSVASHFGKEVDLQSRMVGMESLSKSIRPLVLDAMVQLVRNSVAHGIETPEERLRLGKQREGTIWIESGTKGGAGGRQFLFRCRDDGSGLNVEKIRRRALELGMVSAFDAPRLGPDEATAMIFAPGFSTTAQANEHAGRGVGLDLIRATVIDELGGEIRVDFEPDQFCEFTIVVPLQAGASLS